MASLGYLRACLKNQNKAGAEGWRYTVAKVLTINEVLGLISTWGKECKEGLNERVLSLLLSRSYRISGFCVFL